MNEVACALRRRLGFSCFSFFAPSFLKGRSKVRTILLSLSAFNLLSCARVSGKTTYPLGGISSVGLSFVTCALVTAVY